MDLQAHYDAMRAAATQRLASGQAELDAWLNTPGDTRRGLTLLARLPATLGTALQPLLAALQQAEPAQYYYPATDLHLTVLSIISCHPGFALAAIEPEAYRALVREVVAGFGPFTLEFRGLTASPGAVLLQGFPLDDTLAELRQALRQAFRASGLQQSIDTRYRLQTAHATLLRLRTPPHNAARLLEVLADFRDYPLGTVQVSALELVFNDWYQRAAHTVRLENYTL